MKIKPYYETQLGKLYHGDCLDIMPGLEPVDLVLTDPPYGTTVCSWDVVIPFEPMWKQLKRIIKNNGVIALFGNEPFSSYLRISNIKMFGYDWIWHKNKSGNIFQYKSKPMARHEIISIFTKYRLSWRKADYIKYYPQLNDCDIKVKTSMTKKNRSVQTAPNHKKSLKKYNMKKTGYPETIIKINNEGNKLHPTQKPVALMEYLIKTYTNENEIALDFAIGSGTTAVACERLKRKWIGIEIEEKYCEIAAKRIEENITVMERIERSEKGITKKTGLLF